MLGIAVAITLVFIVIALTIRFWPYIRKNLLVRVLGYALLMVEGVIVRPYVAALWFQYKFSITVAVLCLGIWHWRRIRRGLPGSPLKKIIVLIILMIPLFIALSVIRQIGLQKSDCERLAREKRVRPLISTCDSGWRNKIAAAAPSALTPTAKIKADPRTIFPSSDFKSVYCGFALQDDEHRQPVVKINRDTLKIEKAHYVFSPFRGECAPGEGLCFVVSSQKRSLLVIDDRTNTIKREIRMVYYIPLFFALDHENNEVLVVPASNPEFRDTSWEVVTENIAEKTIMPVFPDKKRLEWRIPGKEVKLDDYIWIYNWREDKLKLIFQEPNYYPAAQGMVYYNPPNKTLYVVKSSYDKKIYYATRPNLQFQRIYLNVFNFLMGFGLSNGITSDFKGSQLFMSMPLHGAGYVFDTKTNSHKGRIGLEPGIRDFSFDQQSRTLFAGGYLSGYIYLVDADTWKIKDKVFVGKKIRHIFYSPEIHRLLVTSANGCLEVDPSPEEK